MRYTLHYNFNNLYKQNKVQWVNYLGSYSIDTIITDNPILKAFLKKYRAIGHLDIGLT
jgi:hypothetical protein